MLSLTTLRNVNSSRCEVTYLRKELIITLQC